MHAREGSIDSRLDEHVSIPVMSLFLLPRWRIPFRWSNKWWWRRLRIITMATTCVPLIPCSCQVSHSFSPLTRKTLDNGRKRIAEAETDLGMPSRGMVHPIHPSIHQQNSLVYANVNTHTPIAHKRNGNVASVRANEHPDCIIYSQYETPQGSTSVSLSSWARTEWGANCIGRVARKDERVWENESVKEFSSIVIRKYIGRFRVLIPRQSTTLSCPLTLPHQLLLSLPSTRLVVRWPFPSSSFSFLLSIT